MQKRCLIIGYGNSLRGDDGLGPAAADILADRLEGEPVEIITAMQLTPELAEPISRVDFVLFIDAKIDGTPGTISLTKVYPERAEGGAFVHHVTPGMLLALSRALYNARPAAALLTLTGQDFSTANHLSPLVRCAMPDLVARARAAIHAPHLQEEREGVRIYDSPGPGR